MVTGFGPQRSSQRARGDHGGGPDCWVDGIHLKVRLEQDKVCLLVMIGVRADGTKELIASSDKAGLIPRA
jgi:hypothetical protein